MAKEEQEQPSASKATSGRSSGKQKVSGSRRSFCRGAKLKRTLLIGVSLLLVVAQFIKGLQIQTIIELLRGPPDPDQDVRDKCVLKSTNHLQNSNATLQQSLARIVVLQKNGGEQLETLLHHYTQALDPDDIVVIDNMSTDSETLGLLDTFTKKGIHVWKCSSVYRFNQGRMVTHVMRWAAPFSDWIFPVDVDELMAVRVTGAGEYATQTTTSNTTGSLSRHNQIPINKANPEEATHLVWTKQAFRDALALLDSTAGKMLKIAFAIPIPAECHYDPDDAIDETGTTSSDGTVALQQTKHPMSRSGYPLSSTGTQSAQKDFCGLKYVNIEEVGCISKSFSHGKDFIDTMDGNHWIRTKNHAEPLNIEACEEDPSSILQPAHSLALIHLSDISFQDWFFHGLRGAHGDGHISGGYPAGCTGQMRGWHTCYMWEDFNKVGFNPVELQQQFKQRCPKDKTLKDWNTLRMDSLVQASCNL